MGWKKEKVLEARGWRLEARNPRAPSSVPRFPTSAQRLAPRAFTLTELLVVITIIAILASLITAAAVNALNASKRARISLEINQLGQSMEEVKNKYSAYPPNGMNDGTIVVSINDFVRMFKKAFPRHNEPEGLIRALAGATGTLSGNPTALPGGLTSAEAVYFWLGGFSEDPQYPISGPGGPSFISASVEGEILENRNRIYEFDLARLGPRTDSGIFDPSKGGRFIEYNDPRDNTLRRINLWTYTPSGSTQPYVYFDASRYDPIDFDPNLTGYDPNLIANTDYFDPGDDFVCGIKKVREGQPNPPAVASDIVFVNKGKFQILHCGLDDAWGSTIPSNATDPPGFWSQNINQFGIDTILFPTGPFTGDVADTLTNFTSGTLESEQE